MEQSFRHILITRFNVPQNIKEWAYDRSKERTLSKEWLDHRIQLFIRFTLASVAKQNSKNFTWLLFFDLNTKDELKALCKSLSEYDFIKCIYVSDPWDMDNHIRMYVEAAYKESAFEYLISSRMDNDDCIHPGFIEEIQNNFIASGRQVINFDDGLILKIGQRNALFECSDPSNAFISIIEKYHSASALELVFSGSHLRFEDDEDMHRIKAKRYWMQIVHERNLANDIRGRTTMNEKYLREYHIEDIRLTYVGYVLSSIKLWLRRWRKRISQYSSS